MRQVDVYQSGFNVTVTECMLKSLEIYTPFQQMRGKTVPQAMYRRVFSNLLLPYNNLECTLECLRGDGLSFSDFGGEKPGCRSMSQPMIFQ